MQNQNGTKIKTKAGFIAVVGRPNVGKSSLLNYLVGDKIALVSHKANATRKRMNIIVMYENAQLIFVDTPGIHHQEKLLNQYMLGEAIKAMGDADISIFLADATDQIKYYEEFLELNKDKPHILVLSKVDKISSDEVLQSISKYQKYQNIYSALVPISINKGIGEIELLNAIKTILPLSPYFFDTDIMTNEHVRDIYKEFIRESIFENLSEEIPYESDVLVISIKESDKIDKIEAQIIVEKSSQKGMIIGKGGQSIKRVGMAARKKIEIFSGIKCFLKLNVVVKKGWSKDAQSLEKIGYRIN